MSDPGLANQSSVRTTARVAAVVLLLVAVVTGYLGITGFASQMNAPTMDNSGFANIGLLAIAGFSLVGGLAAANVGWMRAGARYVAGETVPVIKDSLDYVQADGEFCSACGTQAKSGARFCSSCGAALN